MAQFKDLFTELRRDTGLSQEDFAALFHQSGSTISSYETGRNQPSFDMCVRRSAKSARPAKLSSGSA